jgi:hypothetical protein
MGARRPVWPYVEIPSIETETLKKRASRGLNSDTCQKQIRERVLFGSHPSREGTTMAFASCRKLRKLEISEMIEKSGRPNLNRNQA